MKHHLASATGGKLLHRFSRFVSKRTNLAIAMAAAGVLAPCGQAMAQLSGTATISTDNGGVSGASIAQPDFSNTSVVGWEDYSNNSSGNAAPFGGPGQVFVPTSAINLQSITVKGFGDAGHTGTNNLSGNWTITIGTVNGNSPGWGAGVTILDTETASGTPISTDVANGVTTNYDQFKLQNQIALTPGTDYFFAITSNNATNAAGAWYAFAKSAGADPTAGVSAIGLNTATSPESLQNVQGFDYTYFINGSLVHLGDVNANWVTNGNGNYVDAPNWSPSAPATAGSTATFGTNGGTITTSPVVNVTGTQHVSTLTFSNPLGYTLSGPGSILTGAPINVTAGNNTINLTGSLTFTANPETVNVATGSSLTIPKVVDNTYGALTQSGGGTLVLGGISSGGHGLNLTASGTITLMDGAETAASGDFFYDLNTSAGSTINLGANNFINNNSFDGPGTINIGAGTTLVASQYNGLTFNGSLTGSGALILGSAAGSAGGPYVTSMLGTSPAFSGPITATFSNVLQVGTAATLGDGSATNILTLDFGTLQAAGNTTLAQPIVLTDTQGLNNGIDYINTALSSTAGVTGNTLTLTGNISGGGSLEKDGIGMLILSGKNTYGGGTNVTAGTLQIAGKNALPANSKLTIASGAIVQLATNVTLGSQSTPNPASSVSITSLSIASGGTLDINNNHIIINYGTGADPIASIKAMIASGYAGGAWTGTGIMSTAAQSNSGSYGIGYADSADPGNPAGLSSGQIEVMYTLLGDANLDGAVNGSDFAILATNFNKAVSGWDQGDFNYDGAANGSDFALLASNFNKGASQSAASGADVAALDSFAASNGLLASVPEPASMGVLVVAGMGILSRRRGRRAQRQ